MIKITAKKEVRFSIVVIFFGIGLIISTFFFPWIAIKEAGDGGNEFVLNYEMMRVSTSPEIQKIANDLNVINAILLFLVIMGLLSLLSVSYHSASKTSYFGLYLITLTNIFIIIVSFVVLYLYFSLITYIGNIETISLSSPYLNYYYSSPGVPYFNFSLISFIGSINLSIISGLYGSSITLSIFKYLKEIKKFLKKQSSSSKCGEPIGDKSLGIDKLQTNKVNGLYSVSEKNVGLPAFSIRDSEQMEKESNEGAGEDGSESFIFAEPDEATEAEIKDENDDKSGKKITKPFSFYKSDEEIKEEEEEVDKPEKLEKKSVVPFSFDKSKEKVQVIDQEKNADPIKQKPVEDLYEDSKGLEKNIVLEPKPEIKNSLRAEGFTQENKQIHIVLDKKVYTIRCPQCKHIFTVSKSGDITPVKCPFCGREGSIR